MSSHARAYAVLSTPEAFEQAKQKGIQGDPQQSRRMPEVPLHWVRCASAATRHAFTATFNPPKESDARPATALEASTSRRPTMRDQRGRREPRADSGRLGIPACAAIRIRPRSRSTTRRPKKKIAHPTRLPALAEEPRYKTPLNVAVRPDGKGTVRGL